MSKVRALELENEKLKIKQIKNNDDNAALRARIAELEAKLAELKQSKSDFIGKAKQKFLKIQTIKNCYECKFCAYSSEYAMNYEGHCMYFSPAKQIDDVLKFPEWCVLTESEG